MSNHLFALMRSHMPAADRTFIESAGEHGTLTYGDAVALSGRIANLLVERGVEPGDRVAVQTEKSAEAIVLYLACIRAGAVYLPLNTAYTLTELDYFIGDAEPKVVVCSPEGKAGLEPLARSKGVAAVETLGTGGTGSLLEEAAKRPSEFADIDRGPDDLAAFLYTSGTTGRSKGAMLSHDNLASNALTLAEVWRFTRRRCAAPRSADLPYPRLVRRDQRHADGGIVDDLRVALRRRRDAAADAPGYRHDGRADILCAPAPASRTDPRGDGPYAAVRFRLRSAADRDA